MVLQRRPYLFDDTYQTRIDARAPRQKLGPRGPTFRKTCTARVF